MHDMTQKEIDALDLLHPLSMVVSHAFYAEWTYWRARVTLEALNNTRLTDTDNCDDVMRRCRRVRDADCTEIWDYHLGDDFSYRGIEVRLDDNPKS